MRAKELERIAKGKEHNEATKAANHALQAFKLKDIERQKEQERAIEAYSAKKAAQQVRCWARAQEVLLKSDTACFARNCDRIGWLATTSLFFGCTAELPIHEE